MRMVAQLVEWGRRKPRVAGSNPAHRVQRHVQQK